MDQNNRTILICRGTGCESTKSPEIQAALEDELQGLDIEVKLTGCHGMCQQGPIVVIEPEDVFYANVKVKDVPKIVENHIKNGVILDRLCYKYATAREKRQTYP